MVARFRRYGALRRPRNGVNAKSATVSPATSGPAGLPGPLGVPSRRATRRLPQKDTRLAPAKSGSIVGTEMREDIRQASNPPSKPPSVPPLATAVDAVRL